MDTGEYDTNTLLINNISAIGFRFYELISAPAQYPVVPSILTEVDRLAQNDGHLIHTDYSRRGIWSFQLPGRSTGIPYDTLSDGVVQIYRLRFMLVEEGAFEPVNLLKNRVSGPNSANTPNSSSSAGSALDNNQILRQSFAVSPLPPPGTSNHPQPDAACFPTSIVEVHEYFISALLSSLTSVFAKRLGAVPLNSRSVALPRKTILPDEQDRETTSNTVATFRAYLTTTGTLVISLSLSALDGLLPLVTSSTPIPRSTVFIAPSGLFGELASLKDAHSPFDNSLAQSPDTQILPLRGHTEEKIAQWRQSWTKLLERRGINPNILEQTTWVTIQNLRSRPGENKLDGKRSPLSGLVGGITYPGVLCFSKRIGDTQPGAVFKVDDGAVISSRTENYDPLSGAKSWFMGTSEREETIARRRKEREAVSASREANETDHKSQHLNGHSYSPLTLRRTSNSRPDALAVSAMYPTPPDGVQTLVGVTPQFDGVVSSPANGANPTPVVDLDSAISGTAGPRDGLGDMWEAQEPQRSRAPSFLNMESENLFGDIGDDPFGEDNDVTDADFNFFDNELGLNDIDGLGDLGSGDMLPQTNGHSTTDTLGSKSGVNGGVSSNPPGPQPTFAKPELKHARSSLTDNPRPRTESQSTRIVPVKRQPSPFNPDTVFKRVRASLDTTAMQSSVARRPGTGSVFEKVEFDGYLSEIRKKYEDSGRFECHDKQLTTKGASQALPETDYLKRHGRGRTRLKPPPSNVGVLISRIATRLDNTPLQQSPRKVDEGSSSDADDISVESDEDDISSDVDALTSPLKSIGPIRPLDDDSVSVVASLLAESVDENFSATSEIARLGRIGAPEIYVPRYFADPEPFSVQLSVQDDDFMTIAQILTDQAASGFLKYPPSPDAVPTVIGDRRRELAIATRQLVQLLHSVVSARYGEVLQSQFRTYVDVPDVPLLGQPTRMQSRPNAREDQKPSHLFPIGPPHIELKRNESKLSLLPSSVPFWESLGLAPSQGTKNVNAVCVFPDWEGIADGADIFLDGMRSAYESLKLGSFSRIRISAEDSTEGILAFEVEKISTSNETVPRPGSPLTDKMVKLCHAMTVTGAKSTNFVIFFVYSSDNPRSVVECCSGFQLLYQMYKKALSDRRIHMPPNELVLQLVPLDYIASSTSLALLSPSEFNRLCVETYDRCTMFGGPMPAPAIVLEQPFPKPIDFKLTASPSASILHENSCMHIAYAQSVDGRWITAAWTDNRGSQQHVASYCLGRRGMPLSTSIADVAQEIWFTTQDIMAVWKVHWRVIITKCGPMSQPELAFWQELGNMKTNQTSISLTLVTVDTNPNLQLLPPIIKVPATTVQSFYTTPVSTPGPSIMSPEHHTKDPLTPGGDSNNTLTEADVDATLVDVSDRSWGAILSHRLNTSSSLTELMPALVSGYLVKRGGPNLEDPPVVMEVNIMHSELNARLYENLLREMLAQFRGLGTLARVRAVTERDREAGPDVRPWHIAAVEKALKALYLLM